MSHTPARKKVAPNFISRGSKGPLRMSGSIRHSSDSLALAQSMPELGQLPTHHCVSGGESLRKWSEIAKESGPAVVKILSQVVEFDWSQPYRRSAEGEGIGSGFFISNDIIVTNAHVVEGAQRIWITLPREGERRYNAEVIGVCFDVDLALLRPSKEVPVTKILELGESDEVSFGEEVMTLGYPLGMNSLKLTVGIVSGRQDALFQTDAPLNPGNSGGPMLNRHGNVIGINVAIVEQSQNVGFAIPARQLRMIFDEMRSRPKKQRILHKPILGVDFCNASDTLLEFLECPTVPGADVSESSNAPISKRREGVYVSRAFKGFPLYEAGVRDGDVIHSFDGFELDNFGYAEVPWSDARVTLADLMSLLTFYSKPLVEYSRNGALSIATVNFSDPKNPSMPILPVVRYRYPPYEKPDYEVIGGLCVMQLALNHVELFGENASGSFVQELLPVATSMEKQLEPSVIVSNVLVGSLLSRYDVIQPGMMISKLNDKPIKTLEEFRSAFAQPIEKNGKKYISITSTGNEYIILPFIEALAEEPEMSEMFMYQISPLATRLITEIPELKKTLHRARKGLKNTSAATLLKSLLGGANINLDDLDGVEVDDDDDEDIEGEDGEGEGEGEEDDEGEDEGEGKKQ